jgi:hypothetical protein
MQNYKSITAISIIVAAIIIGSCKTKFDTTRTSYRAERSSEAFARGKILVYSSCGGCHYNREAMKFIGTPIHDVPGFMGKVYSANLTNSKSHGIPPRYSDAELRYLLKTGIARDGRFVSYMLRPNMSDEDLNAVIVYLRSDDPAIAADDTTIGLTKYSVPGKLIMNATAKPLPYKPGIKTPSENDKKAMGAYLVDNIGCFHCHSKSFTSLNYLNPEQSKGYMAGGLKFEDPAGLKLYASNLTPDKQTGIGNYTKMQFLKAVKDGEAPNRKLQPPMPKFQQLKDGDVDAIYAYLQTIPAKYHKVQGQ